MLDFVSQTVRQAPSEPMLAAANVFSPHRLKRSNLASNPGLFVSCCDVCAHVLSLFNRVLMPETFGLQMQVRVHAGSAERLQMRREMCTHLIRNLSLIRYLAQARRRPLLQARLLYPSLCLNVR